MSKNQKTKDRLIGIISDTHNLVRPEAVDVLKDTELIIHAGDICSYKVLQAFEAIAPVVVVRGNNDKGSWAKEIPVYKVVEIGEIFIYVIHDIKDLKVYPPPSKVNVIISGHSHKPLIKEHNDILYLNPGSAGPKRFNLPVSVATLKIKEGKANAEIIQLLV